MLNAYMAPICFLHVQVQKFYMMRTQLQGVGLQLQTMKSADAMANAMKSATKVRGVHGSSVRASLAKAGCLATVGHGVDE